MATGLTYRYGMGRVCDDDILSRTIIQDGLATPADVERWRTPPWVDGIKCPVLDPKQPFLLDFTRWQLFNVASRALWRPFFHVIPSPSIENEKKKSEVIWRHGTLSFARPWRTADAF
jgi:hypothetical protein